MALTSNKVTSFTFLHQNQVDKPTISGSAAFKANMDSQAQQLQTGLNGLIDALISIVAGSSGAENIGSPPIAGVAGTNVYAQLSDLKAQLNGAVAGTIPDGSLTEAKLAFAVATQTELDAASVGSKLYAYRNMGGL